MKRAISYCLLLALLPGLACKKYEDGPALSLRTPEKRLTAGKWAPNKVIVNGEEVPDPVAAGYFNHSAPDPDEPGVGVFFYKVTDFINRGNVSFGINSIEPYAGNNGRWELLEDGTIIRLTLIDYILPNGQPLQFDWKIKRLYVSQMHIDPYKREIPKHSDLWVEEQRGNDVVEFHFSIEYQYL